MHAINSRPNRDIAQTIGQDKGSQLSMKLLTARRGQRDEDKCTKLMVLFIEKGPSLNSELKRIYIIPQSY